LDLTGGIFSLFQAGRGLRKRADEKKRPGDVSR